ncbi:MAG: translocation/assembly module TamB domain-containing protein [Sulfurovum sp.]
MIHILLYNPILFLRKIILYIFIIIIILTIAIYSIANSTVVIQKLATKYAPDYNISFGRIYGNVITGVGVDNLFYNNQKLADSINFRWNPSGLMKQSLIINTLKVKQANIKVIEVFIKSFETNGSDDNLTNDTNSSTPTIPFKIELQKLEVDITAIEYEPVEIKYLKLKVENAIFDLKTFTLQNANLELNGSSNLVDIFYTTQAKDNRLFGDIKITVHKELFDKYEIPIKRDSIGELNLELNISTTEITASLDTQMKQLLIAKKGEFNLDIDRLTSIAIYDINQSTLRVNSNAKVSTPYAKDIAVTNSFIMDNNISYSGTIYAKEILGVEKKYVAPAKNLYINYTGDTKSIKTTLSSNDLEGSVVLPDFTQAIVHIHTKKPIAINQFVSLPKELNQTKANIIIDTSRDNPIYFDTKKPIKVTAIISSDMINIKSLVTYKEKITVKSNIQIPKNSNLREFNRDINWDNISSMDIDVTLLDKKIKVALSSSTLMINLNYNIDNTALTTNLHLGNLNLNIDGATKDNLSIKSNIASIPKLIESINIIYKIEKLPIKGSANISVDVKNLKEIAITIKSPKILYKAGRKTTYIIEDIAFDISLKESQIVLQKYNLTYNKQKIFSTKPSNITIDKDKINIAPFWLNDEIKVDGEYNLKLQKGVIDTIAKSFKISHDMVDVETKIDLKTLRDGNSTNITGDIILINGKIKYDLDQKNFASDSDIIILQDVKDEKPSPFMDKLSIDIKVKTKNHLIYKKSGIDIRAKVDLSIYKAQYSPLMVLGFIELPRGGSYVFQDKKFKLDKSKIYFTGDPTKPTLAITVKYKSLNHKIKIRITGKADNPNIQFSSSPSLTEEQILSVILFDTEMGAENNSGTEMMRMMGGAIAKSALSNLGVKIDHLILGEGNSVEIGKKISNRVTVIYVNDIISSVKIKYEHNRNTDSTLQMSPQSQSYDIIFKKRF